MKTLRYLEISSESWWIKDEQINTWWIPHAQTTVQDYNSILAACRETSSASVLSDKRVVLPTMDDFQRALENEKSAFCKVLVDLYRSGTRGGGESYILFEKLLSFIWKFYSLLRSPIFPKKSYLSLAKSLYKNIVETRGTIYLRAVLASPTAAAEIESFLRCASIFRQYSFNVNLTFLLVRWESLVEVQDQSADFLQKVFEQQVLYVREIVRKHDWSHARVAPINVLLDYDSGSIVSPYDFQESFSQVFKMVQNLKSADSRLSKDVQWITGFYDRQTSLKWLGKKQAFLDLAIRRAIGRYIYKEYTSFEQKEDKTFMVLTSELNKRLLTCYDLSIPLVNIEVTR